MTTTLNLNGTGYSIPEMGDTGWLSNLNSYLSALASAKSGVLTWGISTGVTTAARYAVPGYGAAQTNEVQISCPCTGTLKSLFVKCRTAATGDSVVVVVRKAGANTALTCTVAVSGTTASDAANTVSVTAGDALSVSVTGGAAFSSGAADFIITLAVIAA